MQRDNASLIKAAQRLSGRPGATSRIRIAAATRQGGHQRIRMAAATRQPVTHLA